MIYRLVVSFAGYQEQTIMIAVILPTRGFVFTEVEIAIERNLRDMEYRIFRSFDKKIPDCENDLVEQALALYPSHLLFVEEDTVIPDGGVSKMISLGADIACIDYGVEGWSCIAREKETDEILWCGLGCTLVRRYVFESLKKPYFRTDKTLRLNDWTWQDVPEKKRYGGQDIWFCSQARLNGFSIAQADGECRHLKLEELGKKGYNDGMHTIVEKHHIEKRQRL